MLCPTCNQETKVIDSRYDTGTVRRRRECLGCEIRFTTYEKIEIPHLAVIKKDGAKEPFDKGKIRSGIEKACQKRPISPEQIEAIVTRIEQNIFDKTEDEVTSSEIGNLVMKELKKLDSVAYLRFASVYRSFKNLKSFEKELKSLRK